VLLPFDKGQLCFFSPSYSPPICQHQMLIVGRGETVPNLAVELGRVWILVLLLKRIVLIKGRRAHLLDLKLRTECLNL